MVEMIMQVGNTKFGEHNIKKLSRSSLARIQV
jgi:hypothetical protein